MAATITRREQSKFEVLAMSDKDLSIVKGLRASEINDAAYRKLLVRYAAQVAPRCVAGSLMKLLNEVA
jgi:hypothetical protein